MINLSVSPPLFEAVVMPGKTVKQLYTVSNNGNETTLTPKLVYFVPDGNWGNISLTDSKVPDWISYDQKSLILTISPPENTPETDHFLTLTFETKAPIDLTDQNSTSYKSIIGTNILLTISKDGNPKKSAEIVEFSAPRVVDSFLYPISYNLVLANTGNSFWKPNGKIIINNDKIIKLAPFNVLSNYKRNISCLDDENLVDCKLDKTFLIGKYKAKLEFSIDDDPKIYKAETVTYAFPFLLILVFLVLGIIVKVWRKKKR
ncbi:MAG: hypothetical protein Q8O68_01330 [Candidatus Daviesbacteria bacterium]|nr:hypothetical protein [Candidatus Daviesbacteria bacterium]